MAASYPAFPKFSSLSQEPMRPNARSSLVMPSLVLVMALSSLYSHGSLMSPLHILDFQDEISSTQPTRLPMRRAALATKPWILIFATMMGRIITIRTTSGAHLCQLLHKRQCSLDGLNAALSSSHDPRYVYCSLFCSFLTNTLVCRSWKVCRQVARRQRQHMGAVSLQYCWHTQLCVHLPDPYGWS
jgi:hypothetical protein